MGVGMEPPGVAEARALLGVPAGATAAEVGRQYRKLALVLHPDKAAGEGDHQEQFVAESARALCVRRAQLHFK